MREKELVSVRWGLIASVSCLVIVGCGGPEPDVRHSRGRWQRRRSPRDFPAASGGGAG